MDCLVGGRLVVYRMVGLLAESAVVEVAVAVPAVVGVRRRCAWNVFGESNDGVVGTGGVVLSRGVAGAGHAVFAFENVFGRTCVAVGAGAEVGAFGVCGEVFGVVGVPRYCRVG